MLEDIKRRREFTIFSAYFSQRIYKYNKNNTKIILHDQIQRCLLENFTAVLQPSVFFGKKATDATSIKNLVEAIGLQPGSLYSAFGDKRGLFLAAIDGYFEDMERMIFTMLHTDQTPIVRIETFFNRLVSDSVTDEHRKGCFLVKTLLGIPVHDQEINSRLQTMFGEVEKEFKRVLKEHLDSGKFDNNQSPEES